MLKENLRFKSVSDGHLVYTRHGHTHIVNDHVCNLFISLLKRGILPNSPYLIESARRVLSKESFEKLVPQKKKDKYYNKPKHSKRK